MLATALTSLAWTACARPRLLVAAWALLLAPAAAAQLGDLAPPSSTVVLSPRPAVTVAWQADAHVEGVVFRVYREDGGRPPRVIWQGQAQRGLQSYAFSDAPTDEVIRYEIRAVVDHTELRLGRVRVIKAATLQPASKPSSLPPNDGQGPVSVAASVWSVGSRPRQLMDETAPSGGARDAPPDPPPWGSGTSSMSGHVRT